MLPRLVTGITGTPPKVLEYGIPMLSRMLKTSYTMISYIIIRISTMPSNPTTGITGMPPKLLDTGTAKILKTLSTLSTPNSA